MITAKQLFDSAGWIDITEYFPDSKKVYRNEDALINFFVSRRIIALPLVEAECEGDSIPLNMDEIKAIYQQCKELGWIE